MPITSIAHLGRKRHLHTTSRTPIHGTNSSQLLRSRHRSVAAEDDEYSMSDESIGASNALSVDDLTRLFEVKKVEDFGPDDAKNPRNMQQKKNLDD